MGKCMQKLYAKRIVEERDYIQDPISIESEEQEQQSKINASETALIFPELIKATEETVKGLPIRGRLI